MERWLTIEAGSPVLHIQYRLTNLGGHRIDFLWSLHPALAVTPACELLVPGGRTINGAPGVGRVAADCLEFKWPMARGLNGQPLDLSRVPTFSEAPLYNLAYITELREGWCGMLDQELHAGFAIAFDATLFRCVWAFQTHGGWRGLHTAIFEPCTGYPCDLAQAAASGNCARLDPHQVLETYVNAVSFSGRDAVDRVTREGVVS
jgi:hypothetical protein